MWLQEIFWWLALLAGVLWFFKAYLNPVGGTWILEGDAENPWELMQIGPWVFGEQKLAQGVYKFKGRLKSGVWHLARRDHGPELFEAQGFPATIAFLLSGRMMVEYALTYRAQDRCLVGTMVPLKVTFITDPPRLSHFSRQASVPFLLTKKTTM